MASSRLEILKEMLTRNPRDSFSRYGLAMEYRNAGDLDAAMREFWSLLQLDPDYVPAYFHGGQTLTRLGRTEEARAVYRDGLAVASRKGDQHARSEIQAALDLLDEPTV